MKYITGVAVLMALMGTNDVNAIKLRQKGDGLMDDLMKDLQEDANKTEEPAAEAAPQAAVQAKEVKKVEKKDEKTKKKDDKKKPEAKKDAKAAKGDKKVEKKEAKVEAKKEEVEIPMDMAAIKAYSSVIADAAEDSAQGQAPVVYTETMKEDPKPVHSDIGDAWGSMIQNEISSIKTASVKASKDE